MSRDHMSIKTVRCTFGQTCARQNGPNTITLRQAVTAGPAHVGIGRAVVLSLSHAEAATVAADVLSAIPVDYLLLNPAALRRFRDIIKMIDAVQTETD